jgi:hypothetical protein
MTGCLTVAGLILAGVSLNAFTYNDVPSISWIKDQFIKSGEAFSRQFLAASDRETQLSGQSISVASTNPDFIDPTGITWGVCSTQDHQNGCPAGGYYVDFPAPGSGGLLGPVSTITLKVTDSGPGTHLSAASSFTLRQNTSSNENFPILGSIPNGQVPVSGLRYGPSWFVIDDADESGHDDVIDNNNQRTLTYTWSSDNTAVVANDRIQIDPVGPRNYTVTVLTAIGQQPGRAGITINFKDKDSNTTSAVYQLN